MIGELGSDRIDSGGEGRVEVMQPDPADQTRADTHHDTNLQMPEATRTMPTTPHPMVVRALLASDSNDRQTTAGPQNHQPPDEPQPCRSPAPSNPGDDRARVEQWLALAARRSGHFRSGYPRVLRQGLSPRQEKSARRRLERGKVPALPGLGATRKRAGIEYVPWIAEYKQRRQRKQAAGTTLAIIVVAEALCRDIAEKYDRLRIPEAFRLNLAAELRDIAWGVAQIYADSPTWDEHPQIAEERQLVISDMLDALVEHLASLHGQRQQLHQALIVKRQTTAEAHERNEMARQQAQLLSPPDHTDILGAAWLHRQAAARIANQPNPTP